MHQVVTAQLAAARAGTHSTKTRAEVRGGGAKPWRQKGTGRARQGSIRVAAVAWRWRGARPEAARLPAAHPQEDDPPRAALARCPTAPPKARSSSSTTGASSDAHDEGRARAARRARSAHAGRARRRGCCSCSTAPRTRCGSRSATSATACRSCSPRSSTPTTCSSATGWSSRKATLDATVARFGGRRRRRDAEHRSRSPSTPTDADAGADERMTAKTPATSSSGRSCRRSRTPRSTTNVYTFVVAPDANKIEIRNAVEEIFGVAGHQREHAQPQGQAQAQPAHRRLGSARPTRSGPSSPSPRATASRSSGADDADSQAQAHQPRSPVPDRLRLRRDHHATRPEKSLTKPKPRTGGRNSYGRMTVASPRWWSQAAVPRRRLQARTRTACPRRSRRSSTTRTATRASRCCTTSTARSATSSPRPGLEVGDMLQSGQGSEIRAGNALPLRYIPVGTDVHNVELKPGAGGKLGRGAGAAIQLVAKEGLFATLRLPSTEMRRVPIDCRGTVGSVGNSRGRPDLDRQGRPQPLEGQAPARAWRRHEPGRPPARWWRGQELRRPPPGVAVGQARGPHPQEGQGVRPAHHPPPPWPRRRR